MARSPMPRPATLRLRVNHRPPPAQRPVPCVCTGLEVSDSTRLVRVWKVGVGSVPLGCPLKSTFLFSARLILKNWIKVTGMWLEFPVWYSHLRTVPGSQDIW